ncbi:MAG: permease [Acidobacteria bacterium]|nr:MAG: permease [Acidobacteriota bacterium]
MNAAATQLHTPDLTGRARLRDLAPLLLRGGPADRRSRLLPVAAFAVVTALTLTVAGGAEFFLRLDEVGVDSSYQGVYAALACVALVVLAVPLLALCGSAVRLSTRRRDTRLSSMRLLGAPRRLLVRLSVLEAGGLALAGVLVGVVGHLVLAPLVGTVRFVGGPIGTAAVVPSLPVAFLTIAVLVGTAVVAAALGLQKVAITPLGVRTRELPAGAHWVRAVVALVVIGAISLAGRSLGAAGSLLVAVLVVVGMLGAGLAVLNVHGPWLLRLLSRRSVRRGGSGPGAVTRLLAARTVLDDPRAVWRQVSGVAMVSYVSVIVGAGLALANLTAAGDRSPADVMLTDDLRTGILLTIAIAFATLAASITVHAAAEVFDRRDLYVALDRLGTPRAQLERTRRQVVLRPLFTVCLVSAVAGAVTVLPLTGAALVLDPLTLLAVVGALGLGLLVVRLAVGATTPLLRQVLESPEPVV